MKKQFQGEVTRIIDGELCVIWVEDIERAFDVFYGEVDQTEMPFRVGERTTFVVDFKGPHDLGDYTAWI